MACPRVLHQRIPGGWKMPQTMERRELSDFEGNAYAVDLLFVPTMAM